MSTLTFLCQSLQREEAVAPPAGPEDREPAKLTCSHIIHRRCAWCMSWLGVAPTDQTAAGFTTDTICPSCFNEVRAVYSQEVAA